MEKLEFLGLNDNNNEATMMYQTILQKAMYNRIKGYSFKMPEYEHLCVDESYLDLFNKVNFKDAGKYIEMFKINEKEFYELSKEVFITIFSSSELNTFEEFYKKINIEKLIVPKGAIVNSSANISPEFYMVKPGEFRIKKVEILSFSITRKDLVVAISSIIHEFMHAYQAKVKAYISIYMEEFFPIVIERVVSHLLAEKLNEEKIVEAGEIIRTNNTVNNRDLILYTDKLMNKYGNNPRAKNDMFIYEGQLTNSIKYFIDDIYAYAVVEKYKENPKLFYKKFREVIKGVSDDKKLLEFYEISMKDDKMIEQTEKRLELYKSM